MERLFVLLLSFFFSHIHLPGMYRLVNMIYGYKVTRFQKGVWVVKKYLDQKYNLRIHLYSKDLIDHKILFMGTYERATNSVLEHHVKPGHVVVEAGANTGTETLLISRLVGAGGKVLAFEPVSHVASRLEKNIALNGILNTEICLMALGEKEEQISFFIFPPEHPNQGMGSKVLEHSGLEQITVQQSTLDALFQSGKLQRVDFIKMDVQGAELDILRGARQTISAFRPVIFLEAAENLSSIEAMYQCLAELEYVVFRINPGGNLSGLSLGNLTRGNWLAFHQTNHEATHSKS